MRKLLTFLIALAVFAPLVDQRVEARFPRGFVSGSSYTGPGDVVSGAIAFYSCRAYSAANAGTKAYRIVRASDSTQTDINSLANGLCDTSTPATFCNATTCKIVTYYDQSGANVCTGGVACDITQATDANRPAWQSAAVGSNNFPCAFSNVSSGSISLQSAALASSRVQQYTFENVVERTADFSSVIRYFGTGSVGERLAFSNAANQVAANFGVSSTNATANDSTPHAIIVIGNGASSNIVVDGSANVLNAGTNALSSFVFAMSDLSNPSEHMYWCEGGIWPSGFNSSQYGNMNTNMHSATNGWNF